MKKQICLFMAVIMLCSVCLSSVSAYTEIDYSCYEGTWYWDQGDGELQIKSCTDTVMQFYFRYGQFAVNVDNAQVNGTEVYGEYYEVWNDNVWDNYVLSGNFRMRLGESGIWIDWTSSENGSTPLVQGMMLYMPGFYFRTNTVEEPDITVMLNGTPLVFDQSPILYDDRVMVPVRTIFEALGYSVAWDAQAQKVTAKNQTDTLTLWIGNKNLYHNDQLITSDVSPMLVNSRTLVPVRVISQCAGYHVSWNENTNTVSIASGIKGVDVSPYIGVWQYYSQFGDIPEVELIIRDVSDGVVKYDLLFYRLAGYEDQSAILNDDGTVRFSTVENKHSNAPISGTMRFEGQKVVLEITASEFMYVKPQTIVFSIKSAESILQ